MRKLVLASVLSLWGELHKRGCLVDRIERQNAAFGGIGLES